MKISVLIVAVACGLALAACDRGDDRNEKVEKTEKTATPGAQAGKPLVLKAEDIKQAGIKTELVQVQMTDELISLTATVTPNQQKIARVSPRISGRIATVLVVQGAHVTVGQLLGVLESSELGDARSAYSQAKSETDVALAALIRADSLAREEIIAQKELVRARADAERARATLRAAEDKLRLLGVVPSDDLKRGAYAAYPLTAPFAGTVIERKAVVGEVAQSNEPLFTVADLSYLWLEADVFEKDLGKLSVGAPARISLSAYPDHVFSGKLTYLGDTMDKTTRTVKARIEAPNNDGKLKPGMFATVGLRSNATAQAIVVPEQAVVLYQGHSAVFIESQGGFIPRVVEPGSAIGQKVPIKAGLSPGERVVVAGTYELKARLLKSQFATED